MGFWVHNCVKRGQNPLFLPTLDPFWNINDNPALTHLSQAPPSYGFGRYGFGFFGPRIAFRATDALWGRATPFFLPF